MTCVSRGGRSEDPGVAMIAGERAPATLPVHVMVVTLCTERSRMEEAFQRPGQRANLPHGVKNIGYL